MQQNILWKMFLSPVVRLLIDQEQLRRYANSIDWEQASDRFRQSDFIIPPYYNNQNFHGIEGRTIYS